MDAMPRVPLAAFITSQHIPWCPDCAKHHNGNCEDTDVARSIVPTVNANFKVEDDDDGSVTRVTDGAAAGMKKRPRTRTFALTDCVVYDADGNVIRTIPKRKPRKSTGASKRADTVKVAKVIETARFTLPDAAQVFGE